jgi:hypothetical protein
MMKNRVLAGEVIMEVNEWAQTGNTPDEIVGHKKS